MNQNELLAHIKPQAEKINEVMQHDLAATKSPLLSEVIQHAVFTGGKRIRPLLTVVSARLIDQAISGDAIYRLAMVFEYLHAASLLHDDVIDHAEQRRGKPSANTMWGNTPVILAGDYLHTRAMWLAGTVGKDGCLEIIARATSAMVESEFLQMQTAQEQNSSEENYFSILRGKTAALIAAACETGGVQAGGDERQCSALRIYGENLGLAFQVKDDLLDYLGDPEKTGKAVGNDFIEGKMTLPLIRALARAEQKEKETLLTLLAADREKRSHNRETVRALIEKHEGFHEAGKVAEQLVEEAIDQLDIFPDGREKTILTGLAQYVLTREK